MEEAMKKLTKNGFRHWWARQLDPTAGDIWQYFQREFPREAVEKFIKHIYYDGRKHKDEHLWNFVDVSSEINALERLWNGGVVCPTCGGGGEVACDVRYPDRDCVGHTVPCPDCTEQDSAPIYQRKIGAEHYSSPDERKGQRRVHIRRRGKIE